MYVYRPLLREAKQTRAAYEAAPKLADGTALRRLRLFGLVATLLVHVLSRCYGNGKEWPEDGRDTAMCHRCCTWAFRIGNRFPFSPPASDWSQAARELHPRLSAGIPSRVISSPGDPRVAQEGGGATVARGSLAARSKNLPCRAQQQPSAPRAATSPQ